MNTGASSYQKYSACARLRIDLRLGYHVTTYLLKHKDLTPNPMLGRLFLQGV